jgi:hypothetical protein
MILGQQAIDAPRVLILTDFKNSLKEPFSNQN